MGLRDIDIKPGYVSKGEKLLTDFLLPAINESIHYDRVTSFYTIDSLLAISQGIQSLYKKHGNMRLIIGVHSFPSELIDASLQQEFLSKEVKKIRQQISKDLLSIGDALEKEQLATLAWMIQDKLLEVKVASVKGDGLFHPKTLILVDKNEDTVVAIGSPNETSKGLGGNIEQLMVAKSWENNETVDYNVAFFDSLWNGEEDDVITSDVTEETKDMILHALGNKYIKAPIYFSDSVAIIEKSSKMPVNYFVSGDIPALFLHQERAVIDALSRWPVRVLFSDEVGLGKTFEVAATMTFLRKYCGVKRVVILTPKSVLQQWQDELREHFGIEAWLYDSSAKEYVTNGKVRRIGNRNPLGSLAPDIVLMSAQLARGSRAQDNLFSKNDTILPDLLVLDEAHSARVSKDFSGKTKKTRMYSMLEEITNKIPHVILATATPMQKEASEYHALLNLLGLPKAWQKSRNFLTSLRLIASDDVPDLSDAYSAATLLVKTLMEMKPDISCLGMLEQKFISDLLDIHKEDDQIKTSEFVQKNWEVMRPIFIRLHPAHLLTIRNTRRSLEKVGYTFPVRKLVEESINNSVHIELFYDKVNNYLTDDCFSVEKVINSDKNVSLGFVRVSYQQRAASSLYSCKRSLERRYTKLKELKDSIDSLQTEDLYNAFSYNNQLDSIEIDDYFTRGDDESALSFKENIDISMLKRQLGIETTALSSLVSEAEKIIKTYGDLKILKSIDLAMTCLGSGDSVLLFSRYTDTVQALLNVFTQRKLDQKYIYGIYTGEKSVIVRNGMEEPCDKARIKRELFSGNLRIMFCSDAASEGLNLQAARVLINVDVPWTPARLEQRIGRVARLGQTAKQVDIYNVWYPHSIEARMYHRIQKRLDETNLAIGEFPDIVAEDIKQAVIDNNADENTGIEQLKEIRNSFQTKGLESLWSLQEEKISYSSQIRHALISLCDENFSCRETKDYCDIKEYEMPDDTLEALTIIDGLSETISLKSKPWKYMDFKSNSVSVEYDSSDRPMIFISNVLGNRKRIKPESVFKIINNEELDDNDILDEYPKMLPDFDKLDTQYALDTVISSKPKIWRKE